MEEYQSLYINRVKVLLMFAVCFLHTSSPWAAKDYIGCNNLIHSILGGGIWCVNKVVFQYAVPLFYVISGYLYFYNIKCFTRRDYIRKTKSRVRSLLVPYLLWNIVYGLFFVVIAYKGGNEPMTISQFITGLIAAGAKSPDGFTSPFNGPFWFLRDLIVVSLLSPIIYAIIKPSRKCDNTVPIILVALIGLAYIILPTYGMGIPGLSWISIFFFTFGSYLGLRKINLLRLLKGNIAIYVSVCIALVLLTYKLKDCIYYDYIYRVQRIVGVVTLLRILPCFLLHTSMYYDKLYSSTFFVYASHVIISNIILGILRIFISVNPIMYYIVNPIAVYLTCTMLYRILNMVTPRVLCVFVGSRN